MIDIFRLSQTINSIKAARDKERVVDARLPSIIVNISEAFHNHWQEENLPLAHALLKALYDGIPIPVLAVCGRGTEEIRFTKYLSYFLDPHNMHGLGSLFIRSVFKNETAELNNGWFESCNVTPEMRIGQYPGKGNKVDCYCDIGITGDGFLLVIEQKIFSGEDVGVKVGLSQLKRYSYALENNKDFEGLKIIKIYLTPHGRLPEGAEGWQALSHIEIVKRCLKLFGEDISCTAKENLLRLLFELSTGPYERTESTFNEIKDTAYSLINHKFSLKNLVKFRQIIDKNRLPINIILEGHK